MEEDIDISAGIVVDASTVLNFLMPDEKTSDTVDHLFEQIRSFKVKAFAPEILSYEVTNALRSAVLSNRASKNVALSIFKDFTNLGVTINDVNFLTVLKIAVNKKMSVYDASYAYLANSRGIYLVTSDSNLSKIAKKAILLEQKK